MQLFIFGKYMIMLLADVKNNDGFQFIVFQSANENPNTNLRKI